MTDHAVFEIEIKENGEVAFNKLASGSEKFHGSAGKARESANELGKTFDRLKDTMLAAGGIFEVLNFAKEGEQLYLGVKRADAEIKASLESTKGAAGVTNDQLKEGSETLYHHSEFTMENIKKMQSVLLTFPKVAAGQFDEASQAIIDTAAKLGGKDADLQGMAIRIGKALQDPATGMMMLRREGVNFTKAQQHMVEGMVKAGHQAEAQKYILHELETEFGGSAQAALTAGGAHEQMAKTVEELKIQVGEFVEQLETDLVPVFSVVVHDLGEVVKWAEKHKQLLETTAKVVVVLVAAYTAYRIATWAANAATEAWAITQGLFTDSAIASGTAIGGVTTEVEGLSLALESNPFGLVIAGLTGVAGAAALWWHGGTKEAVGSSSQLSEDQKADEEWETKKAQIRKDDLERVKDHFAASKDIQAAEITNMESQLAFHKHKYEELNSSVTQTPSDKLEIASARAAMYSDSYLLGQFKGIPDSKKGAGNTSGVGLSTPGPESVKANEKQITNTWNIKEFGKTNIYPSNMTEGASDTGDMMLKHLTAAVNDSEIASGQ